MRRDTRISPYKHALRTLAVCGLAVLIWLIGAITTRPGFAILALALLMIFVLFVVWALLYLRCPRCRTSVFTAYKSRWLEISRAWPSKRCCVCEVDLTAPFP